MLKKIWLGIIVLALIGCQKESSEWNPVFEYTGFDFFYTEIDRSLSVIEEVYSEAENGNTESVKEKLNQVKSRLFAMKDYYVPLTTIRQNIYDAERFFKLGNRKESEELLNNSKSVLTISEITAKNKVFDKVVLDLESMIDEVILSLHDDSELNTYNRMKTLGEHINLMLSKGDLVLSGVEFDR